MSVISGAIDLRYKTAISAMTPLPKVMLLGAGIVGAELCWLQVARSKCDDNSSSQAGVAIGYVSLAASFWQLPAASVAGSLALLYEQQGVLGGNL